MRWFGFLCSVRFWIAVWIVVLFVGLLPLPPAIELIILVGFVAHSVWFAQRRFRRAAELRAFARAERAEEEEYRRLRRRRALRGDSANVSAGAELAKPMRHGVLVGWAVGHQDSNT